MKLMDVIDSNGLRQNVYHLTQECDNTLDLVITHHNTFIKRDVYMSDIIYVHIDLPISKPSLAKMKVSYRK